MDLQGESIGTGGFLNPQKIIDNIGIIEKGMKIADFGSGSGYFTLPLLRRVGDAGKVFAIDVLPEALEVVRSKAKAEGFNNVRIIRSNLERKDGSTLKDESCDIIWMANILFQTEDDSAVLQEAKRVLKKEGIVVFIDWKPEVAFGPPGKKIKREEAENLFKEAGFIFQKEFPTDNYHYGLIFKK